MSPYLLFENVGKAFRTGASADSLVEMLTRALRRQKQTPRELFWALRGVSFSVHPGEVLGIIGPNGAGKSTVLKLLNYIIEPTKGDVYVNGRVGALIEISAGFHPDLTGRQNVFLQGSIMGMRDIDIRRKFDDIVAFSGIEAFIDTPVKRYSSGMNARLGFSIAAHLEPEILIIDEVLAVGDYAFQAKAYDKIKSMAKLGIPVVLVSHQLDKVADLCTKAILLNRGAVACEGTAAECIAEYLSPPVDDDALHQHDAEFDAIDVRTPRPYRSGGEIEFVVSGRLRTDPTAANTLAVRLLDPLSGRHVFSVVASDYGQQAVATQFRYVLTFQLNVPPGEYLLEAVYWDSARNVDLVHSPRVPIEVLATRPFWGSAQLNAQWRNELSDDVPSHV